MNGETVFLDAVCLSDTPDLQVYDAMMKYQTLGCLLIIGPDLEDITEQLLKKYGKHKTYGTCVIIMVNCIGSTNSITFYSYVIKRHGKLIIIRSYCVIGSKYTKDEFFGVSPISFEIGSSTMSGCVLKFAVDRPSKVR